MTSISLARSYFLKARKRLRALEILFDEEAYSDVVREAQELVELALKGMLRFIGIEPPKQHDVGPLLLQYRDRLPPSVGAGAERLAEISHRLRKEREFAFYGDEDFIPTDEYTREQAAEAVEDARWVVGLLDPFPARDPQA
ncbi:MAG: HEPN domain-containing protein [Deltaproteobacteria bacterium]|nr:MAG: HEPN domain-containing protein [Deltaproteobacteria bacterium]